MSVDRELVLYISLLIEEEIIDIESLKESSDKIPEKLKFKDNKKNVKDTINYIIEMYEEGEDLD